MKLNNNKKSKQNTINRLYVTNYHLLQPQMDMTLFIQYCLYVLGSIHHFHIDHNVPCLPPNILHNHCLRFLLGRLRNWKQKLCKILEGKQGSLWSM